MEYARNGSSARLLLVSGAVRTVILPATPLLVLGPTPGRAADPLAQVRGAVGRALTELTADGRLPLVLAHGAVLRQGWMRPSLARSGIGERWLPGPSAGIDPSGMGGPWADHELPAAGTGASVALLALAELLGARTGDVVTLEVPPRATALDDAALDDAALALLRRADCLVVAGGGAPGGLDTGPDALTQGIRVALRAAGADERTADVQVFPQVHDHLPPEYRVTVLSDRKMTA